MSIFEVWFTKHPLAHGALVSLSVWLLSAIANLFLRAQSPSGWEMMKYNHPRVAALISMSRALGIDPFKFTNSILHFIRGEWRFPDTTNPGRKIVSENEKNPEVIEVDE